MSLRLKAHSAHDVVSFIPLHIHEVKRNIYVCVRILDAIDIYIENVKFENLLYYYYIIILIKKQRIKRKKIYAIYLIYCIIPREQPAANSWLALLCYNRMVHWFEDYYISFVVSPNKDTHKTCNKYVKVCTIY